MDSLICTRDLRDGLPNDQGTIGNSGALTLLHSEQPKLYGVLAVLSAIGFNLALSLQCCAAFGF